MPSPLCVWGGWDAHATHPRGPWGDACDASKPTDLRDGGLGPPPQAPCQTHTPAVPWQRRGRGGAAKAVAAVRRRQGPQEGGGGLRAWDCGGGRRGTPRAIHPLERTRPGAWEAVGCHQSTRWNALPLYAPNTIKQAQARNTAPPYDAFRDDIRPPSGVLWGPRSDGLSPSPPRVACGGLASPPPPAPGALTRGYGQRSELPCLSPTESPSPRMPTPPPRPEAHLSTRQPSSRVPQAPSGSAVTTDRIAGVHRAQCPTDTVSLSTWQWHCGHNDQRGGYLRPTRHCYGGFAPGMGGPLPPSPQCPLQEGKPLGTRPVYTSLRSALSGASRGGQHTRWPRGSNHPPKWGGPPAGFSFPRPNGGGTP